MSPKLLAISGWKNSGKTTLIERLLPQLARHGIPTAVIKHDGHSFDPDVPGTDTARFLSAGAEGTVVYDGEKYMLVRRVRTNVEELAALFPEAELILVEGLKGSSLPKLSLSENGEVSCSFSPKTFSRDDIPGLTKFIIQTLRGGVQCD